METLFIEKYRIYYLDEDRDLWVVFDRKKKDFKYFSHDDFYTMEGKWSRLLKDGTEGEAWRAKQDKLEKARKNREIMKLMSSGRVDRFYQLKVLTNNDLEKIRALSFKDIFPEDFAKTFLPCPFHNEKNASLKINDNYFYCFGCNRSGSVIDWYMQKHGATFKEAVAELKKFI